MAVASYLLMGPCLTKMLAKVLEQSSMSRCFEIFKMELDIDLYLNQEIYISKCDS